MILSKLLQYSMEAEILLNHNAISIFSLFQYFIFQEDKSLKEMILIFPLWKK